MEAERLLVVVLTFISAVASSGIGVTSRRCLAHYEDGYLFHDTMMTYTDAKDYCRVRYGVLIRPTDKENWEASLKYLRDNYPKSTHPTAANWIGVTLTRVGNTIVAKDSDGTVLLASERSLVTITDSYILKNVTNFKDGETWCVVYAPPSDDEPSWRFQLQAQKAGYSPRARTVCQCISDVKVPRLDPTDPMLKSPTAKTQIQSGSGEKLNSNVSSRGIKPRSGVDDDGIFVGGKGDADSTTRTTTTPLGVIVGLLVACGMVATVYYVSKKRGWDVGHMISSRMPYNRPRPSLRDDTYARGQELMEVSSSNHRPIHVYEEIIPRNAIANGLPSMNREHVLSCSSSISIPRDPPPDPPTNAGLHMMQDSRRQGRKFSEDAYLKPNLNPSFHRGDSIPNDVRSPPPMVANTFNFPSSSNSTPITPHSKHPTKELKYASVETVHTMIDGEKPDSEEYLVSDDEDNAANENIGFGRLVVDIPEKEPDEPRRDSVFNSYVPIKGSPSVRLTENEISPSTSSPVFLCHSEYENERFLKTVMKAKQPTKPARKHRRTGAQLETQAPSGGEDPVVYSRIPSVSKEPVYSKIRKKNPKENEERRESNPSGYTPMRNTLKRKTSPSIGHKNSTALNPDSHHVTKSPSVASTSKQLISTPTMRSTTNKALEDSSLVCYDIPPEFDTFV